MRVLLDTVTFVWSLRSPEQVSRKAVLAMSDEQTIREISVLSLSELAIKETGGKLDLTRAEIYEGLDDLRIRVLSFTSDHARQMFGLPLYHKDPFDRQIISQALAEKISIVTPDRAFRAYQGLNIIW